MLQGLVPIETALYIHDQQLADQVLALLGHSFKLFVVKVEVCRLYSLEHVPVVAPLEG